MKQTILSSASNIFDFILFRVSKLEKLINKSLITLTSIVKCQFHNLKHSSLQFLKALNSEKR